jgi:hypothetical protein
MSKPSPAIYKYDGYYCHKCDRQVYFNIDAYEPMCYGCKKHPMECNCVPVTETIDNSKLSP